jgi:hypothetical protein
MRVGLIITLWAWSCWFQGFITALKDECFAGFPTG